jgi:acetyl-CoA carboxylase carboxyl transferase subunit alpha
VISPEGCASILWKSADKAADAAEVMGITADRLRELGLVDRIIDEPLGGAHRDYDMIAMEVRDRLRESLAELTGKSVAELVEERHKRFRDFGFYTS